MRRKHRVEGYFIGALDEREHEEFRRHLAGCAACQEGLEQLKMLDIMLATSLRHPLQEARPEWIRSMRDHFHQAQNQAQVRIRRLTLGAIPAFSVMLVVILVLIFQPWNSGAPEAHLAQAYSATLRESFQGEFTIVEGASVAMRGTFAYAPDGRWMVSAEHASGQSIEEVEMEGQIWRRNNGGWTLNIAPLFVSNGNVVIVRLPDLLQALPALIEIRRIDAGKYAGVYPRYLSQLREKTLIPEGAENVWLENNPPKVEVEVTDGRVRKMRLIFDPPEGASVIANIAFEGYGFPVQITKPRVPSLP